VSNQNQVVPEQSIS